MTPLPLRTSLTLIYTTLLAVVVSGVVIGYHGLLVRQMDRDASTTLAEIVRGLHGYLRIAEGRPTLSFNDHDPNAVAFVEEATRYYQVFETASGRRLVQSRALEAFGVDYAPVEVAAFRVRLGMHDIETDRGRLRVSSTVLTVAPGAPEYLVQVGLPLGPVDRSIASLERTLWWAIAIGLAGAALAGRWMAARALAPLTRLAEATHAVDVTTLNQRLPLRGAGDELDEVTTGFNQALGRVDKAVGEMRQFSAALAHELRTPLAALRGETELALRHPWTPEEARRHLEGQLEEFDRLNVLIAKILTLARAEAGQIVLAVAPVDLAAVSRSTVEQLEVLADARGIALVCDVPDTLMVDGDASWLERLLLILLDNAITYTPDGGRVVVALDTTPAHVHWRVIDTGPGITAEALPHLFERFYRGDASRSRRTEGAGLGLALASWIAERHGATIAVASEPGHGATFTVQIPRRRSAAPTSVGHP